MFVLFQDNQLCDIMFNLIIIIGSCSFFELAIMLIKLGQISPYACYIDLLAPKWNNSRAACFSWTLLLHIYMFLSIVALSDSFLIYLLWPLLRFISFLLLSLIINMGKLCLGKTGFGLWVITFYLYVFDQNCGVYSWHLLLTFLSPIPCKVVHLS